MKPNAKFSDSQYHVHVHTKNTTLTEPMKEYIREKILKVERFTDHILDITVFLESSKLEYKVNIVMDFFHYRIDVHGVTQDFYSAIDLASQRFIRLVGKYKTLLQRHKGAEHLGTLDLDINVLRPNPLEDINDDIEAENQRLDEEKYKFHKLVAKEKLSLRTLTQDEAMMKLDLSSAPFLIYRDETDHKLKVLYRRADGDFSLLEIE